MMNGMKSALIHSVMKKQTGIGKYLKSLSIVGKQTYIIFEFTIFYININSYTIYVSIFLIILYSCCILLYIYNYIIL